MVEFYYLWKKTPGANSNRPHRRRRQGSLRRSRNTRTNSTGSNNSTNNKKEQTPEPAVIESRPSPKEENSSVTEDEASECDSDSSNTNKGSTLGEDSPSRMRTRNKQTAKDQTSNKRPKRGTETPDVTTVPESPRTPSKTSESKRKNSKDTPSKGKKRANDIDADNIDEKDGAKRKRSDVSSDLLLEILWGLGSNPNQNMLSNGS